MSNDELLHVIEQCRSGNKNAFSKIVTSYQSYLRIHVAKRTSYQQDVDDICQEAFVLAYDKICQLENPQSFRSWLSSIATNLIMNHVRKYQKFIVEDPLVMQDMIDIKSCDVVESDAYEDEKAQLIEHSLLKLNDKSRELVRLHYGEGMTLKELSNYLDENYSTLTMRLHRSRKALIDHMSNKNIQ